MTERDNARAKLKDRYVTQIWQPPGVERKPLFDMDRVWKLMDGAIDVHIHSAPDAYATRVKDELELSIEACQMGMAAVVHKCHSVPTHRSTAVIRNIVNQWAEEHGKRKTDIFGGVVLNYAVGGLNPEAVVVNARLGGKYVWLPTLDASYHRKDMEIPGGIEVIDENDNVVSSLKEIFSLVVEFDLVLGICHQSTKERFILIDEAKKAGVKKIEVCHPHFTAFKMSFEELKILAEKKVYIGLYCYSLSETPGPVIRTGPFDSELALRIIKEIGPDYVVAGTDVGMYLEDTPVEAMRRFICWLLYMGIPDEVVKRLVAINARELLY